MKQIISLTLAVLTLLAVSGTAAAADPAYKLSVRADASGADINAAKTLLTPGGEYAFPLEINIDNLGVTAFAQSHLTDRKISASVTKGTAVLSTPTVEESGGVYYLVVKPKNVYNTAISEAGIKIRFLDSDGKELDAVFYTFDVGQPAMDSAAITALAQGDYLTVDPAAPVITANQFETFAELNLYKTVTLENKNVGWEYRVNVTDTKAANFFSTNEAIMDVVKQNNEEERDYLFVSFPGRPSLGVKGRLSLNVSELTEGEGGKYYVYLYQDGALYYLTSDYDEAEDTVSFNAARLGSYVVTNMPFTGTNVGGTPAAVPTIAPYTNPSTGRGDVLGIASALATLMIVSLAAGRLKKK